jgi:hypothetical protein
MDKRAKIIIFKDEKIARDFANQHILKRNLRISLLEKQAELIEDELDEVLTRLEEEE